jgi:hypothetical protein
VIESYTETKVVLARSGELLLALPVYANQMGALLSEDTMKTFTGTEKISIGVYERMGYIMYHPTQSFTFYLKSIDLFEDLGEL